MPAPSLHPMAYLDDYLAHTVGGVSMRKLAIKRSVAPSTILRRVRAVEEARDDPEFDRTLTIREREMAR